jgi:hypothetical protein
MKELIIAIAMISMVFGGLYWALAPVLIPALKLLSGAIS